MIRITFRFVYDRGTLVLFLVLLLSLFLAGSVVASDNAPGVQAESIALLIQGAGRHYYLTNDLYATDEVLTACAEGYHMASLWEILDVSNLTYDYDHPDAYVQDDSGRGPPSGRHGWVRTGYQSSADNVTGMGNCRTWASTSSSDTGVAVRLSTAWETAAGDIGTWDANSFTCDSIGEVWCVGDFGGPVYLPIIMKKF